MNAYSGTRDGRCAFRSYDTTINGVLAPCFLKHFQHTIDERLRVIRDGSPIHRSGAVKAILEQVGGRIWLERLPGSAPDLNPDEGVGLAAFETANGIAECLTMGGQSGQREIAE